MSPDDNKVDLSSVNKTPKQSLSTKLTNLFKNRKKPAGPGRDEVGRFASSSRSKLWSKSGSTKVKGAKKFNWSRAIPLVAVVALVGGFLVWRSFAGTKLYPNQYSVYKCAGFDNTKIKPDDKCLNDSAEALTFRVYEAMFNRAPQTASTQKDKNGKPVTPEYQYWVQKLAGDRVQPTEMTKTFVSRYAKQSNEQYIDALYQNLLNRKADAKGKAYWKKELDSKRWSREKTAAHFASTSEAKRVQQAAFATFLSKAPRVTIAENAKKTRDERLFTAAANTNKAKGDYNTISKFTADGRKNRDNAKSTAGKSTPSRGDLTSIANNEKAVRDNLSKTSSVINKLKDYERQNKALYDRAKDVAAYSPDISADAIKKQYDSTVFYRAGAENISKELTALIKEISSNYKTAEGKYEAEQNRLAAEVPQGEGDDGGGEPVPRKEEEPVQGATNEDRRKLCNAIPDRVTTTNLVGGRKRTTVGFTWVSRYGTSYCEKITTTKTSCDTGYYAQQGVCKKRSSANCTRNQKLVGNRCKDRAKNATNHNNQGSRICPDKPTTSRDDFYGATMYRCRNILRNNFKPSLKCPAGYSSRLVGSSASQWHACTVNS